MPGPVSDSYDPEWGTRANAAEIEDAIQEVYDKISEIIRMPPLHIFDILVNKDILSNKSLAKTNDGYLDNILSISEYDWRIIRFALERAKESI